MGGNLLTGVNGAEVVGELCDRHLSPSSPAPPRATSCQIENKLVNPELNLFFQRLTRTRESRTVCSGLLSALPPGRAAPGFVCRCRSRTCASSSTTRCFCELGFRRAHVNPPVHYNRTRALTRLWRSQQRRLVNIQRTDNKRPLA